MDSKLIYAKTPTGDEAVRESTRVVQRNLRMVLVQVDGKMSVEELSAKVGNPRLVQAALRELEEGGYIAPNLEAASVWEESKKAAQAEGKFEPSQPLSQFSVFGPKTAGPADSKILASGVSNFSSFGKPILPTRAAKTDGGSKPSVAPSADQSTPEGSVEKVHGTGVSRRHALLGVMGVLLLSVGAAVFYPYDRFKPAIEAAASDFVGAPVRVAGVGVSVFPSPHLKLTGLTIGQGGESSVSEVRLGSPLVLLGWTSSPISRVDVDGARLTSRQLVAMPLFKAEGGKAGKVVISRVVFGHSHLELTQGIIFQDIFGELNFRPDGRLDKAVVENTDRSLLVEAQPGALGIALNIEGRAWQPFGSAASFASLQAKGVLQAEKLLVENLDTTFLGGILRGNWLLDWSNGLAMAGEANLNRIDARKLSSAFVPQLKLEGDISGALRLRASSRDWEGLWRNAEAVLSTEITRGVLNGVDLGEAARRNGVSEVRAGSTRFDRLRSTISISPTQVASKDLRMDAGMMTATGQFAADRNGRVDASMVVTLQTSVSSLNVPVRVYGTLPDLTAVGRK